MMNTKVKIVVEIVYPTNVGFLDTKLHVKNDGTTTVMYKNSIQFAAGELFTTAALDSLSFQAFYNPAIIRVLAKLIGGADHREEGEVAASDLMSEGAAGLKDATVSLKNMIPSCMYQVPVPQIATMTYGALIQHLSNQGIVPVALYRGPPSHASLSPRMNEKPYVYTNPDSETELFPGDSVFILSQKPQPLRGITGLGAGMMNYHKHVEEKKHGKKHLSKALKDDLNFLEMQQEFLREKLESMTQHIEEKRNEIMEEIWMINN